MRLPMFTAVAFAGLVALAGCASLAQRALFPIARGSTHLVWETPPFNAVTPAGIRYGGVAENEDYMLFRAGATQAELVFINALGFGSAIRYPGGGLHKLARTWAVNQNGTLSWGRKRTVATELAQFKVQRYRLDRSGRACAAFEARWDFPSGVPRDWPGKLLFGYICAARSQPLTTKRLTSLLTGLRLRYTAAAGASATLPLLKPIPSHAGGATHGNAHFPFLFSIYQPNAAGGRGSPEAH